MVMMDLKKQTLTHLSIKPSKGSFPSSRMFTVAWQRCQLLLDMSLIGYCSPAVNIKPFNIFGAVIITKEVSSPDLMGKSR